MLLKAKAGLKATTADWELGSGLPCEWQGPIYLGYHPCLLESASEGSWNQMLELGSQTQTLQLGTRDVLRQAAHQLSSMSAF